MQENTPIKTTPRHSLGENAKTIAMVGVGIGVLTLGYKIVGMLDNSEQAANEKKTVQTIKDITVNTSKINSNILVYRTAAETIYGELTNHVLVIDTYSFNDILAAIKGFNTDELKQTVKEFGIRSAKLFNLVEIGGSGSLFEWCDVILNKAERETIKEIFVFTGLDKLPEMGMRYYFNYNDKGWFDKENPMRAVAALWKPFTKTTSIRPVYPIKGNSQWLNVLEQNGTVYTARSIKAAGFGVIGNYVSFDTANIANGIVQQIAIKITDSRLPAWIGKTIWINSREINQVPAPNNLTLYPR
jgi:hypothetical protein